MGLGMVVMVERVKYLNELSKLGLISSIKFTKQTLLWFFATYTAHSEHPH